MTTVAGEKCQHCGGSILRTEWSEDDGPRCVQCGRYACVLTTAPPLPEKKGLRSQEYWAQMRALWKSRLDVGLCGQCGGPLPPDREKACYSCRPQVHDLGPLWRS